VSSGHDGHKGWLRTATVDVLTAVSTVVLVTTNRSFAAILVLWTDTSNRRSAGHGTILFLRCGLNSVEGGLNEVNADATTVKLVPVETLQSFCGVGGIGERHERIVPTTLSSRYADRSPSDLSELLKHDFKLRLVDVAREITDKEGVRGSFLPTTDWHSHSASLLGVIELRGAVVGTVVAIAFSFVVRSSSVDGCDIALFATGALIACRMVFYDGAQSILDGAGTEVDAVKIGGEDVGVMIFECSRLARLCPARRSCGSKKLRALNE
jgi:hypothetical protein